MAKIIGVSGASGSGKSTFSELLIKLLPNSYYLSADKHYKDPLPIIVSPMDGQEYPDWNHPSAIKADAVLKELAEVALKYDYVVVDGAFIYCIPEIAQKLDFKIYIDATIEMRFFRRIDRNLKKGQTLEFIAGYYLNCARFREKEYALTTKDASDLVINNEKGFNGMEKTAAELILSLK